MCAVILELCYCSCDVGEMVEGDERGETEGMGQAEEVNKER